MARKADKRKNVLDILRKMIVDGRWPRGYRLPTRETLRRRHGISHATLQEAMTTLKRQGFLVARGSSGTFVAQNPPHLSRYVIAFAALPGETENGWDRYQEALMRVAEAMPSTDERKIEICGGLGKKYWTECNNYLELADRVRSHQVAGILFATPPNYLQGTPLMDEPGIPRLAIGGALPRELAPEVVRSIEADFDEFYRRAVDLLVQRHCKRLAFISGRTVDRYIESALRPFDIASPSHLRHILHPLHPEGVANLVHMMMRLPPPDRPDGIVISNDHFAENARIGFEHAGIEVGRDVQVVAHWNFGLPLPLETKFEWLGFDIRALLEISFDTLGRWRRNEPLPSRQVIAPCTLDELPESHRVAMGAAAKHSKALPRETAIPSVFTI